MERVFLGGTCNGSQWRDELIPLLNIDYFNPVVENWTPECQAEEIKQREECDFCLYVLTPKMTGFYSIAEVVDDSNKRPAKTILCVLDKDQDAPPKGYEVLGSLPTYEWTAHQAKSLQATMKMVEGNGAYVCTRLEEVAGYLNAES